MTSPAKIDTLAALIRVCRNQKRAALLANCAWAYIYTLRDAKVISKDTETACIDVISDALADRLKLQRGHRFVNPLPRVEMGLTGDADE